MSTIYKRLNKLQKLARVLTELDKEQTEFDRYDPDVAEDIRWSRIFISKAMSLLNEKNHT